MHPRLSPGLAAALVVASALAAAPASAAPPALDLVARWLGAMDIGAEGAPPAALPPGWFAFLGFTGAAPCPDFTAGAVRVVPAGGLWTFPAFVHRGGALGLSAVEDITGTAGPAYLAGQCGGGHFAAGDSLHLPLGNLRAEVQASLTLPLSGAGLATDVDTYLAFG